MYCRKQLWRSGWFFVAISDARCKWLFIRISNVHPSLFQFGIRACVWVYVCSCVHVCVRERQRQREEFYKFVYCYQLKLTFEKVIDPQTIFPAQITRFQLIWTLSSFLLLLLSLSLFSLPSSLQKNVTCFVNSSLK